MLRGLTAVFVVLASLIVTSDTAVAVADRRPGLDAAAIDRFVTGQLRAGHLPGAAVAITRGNEVLHLRGYGQDSSGAPITENTPVRIASLSKSFTSLAVMQLVDEQKVRLDEPVKTYLRDFTTADPRSDMITVRQLLNQTSGMADSGFPELSRPQPSSLEAAVARLHSAKLVAWPGEQWNYHNPNYHVAARLVEVVSGEPFAEYLQRRVFAPLGMDHTLTTTSNDQDVPGLADGYSFAYGATISLPGPGHFVNGSGGLVSTAADMARWLVTQNNGGIATNGERVVSAQSLKEMHTPLEAGGYALGWDTDGPAHHPTRIEHGGTDFTFSCYQILLPDSGYGIAVLFNNTTPLWIEQMTITEGLISMIEKDVQSPEGPTVSSTTVDLILAVLTLATLVLGTRGVLRSRRWANRRKQGPVWRTVLRLLPHVAVVALGLTLPATAGFVFGGRDVTWLTSLYGWLALVILVAAAALAEVAVITARVSHLLRAPDPS